MRKLLITTIILILLIMTISVNTCYATSIIDNPGTYKPSQEDVPEVKEKAEIVLGVIRTVGIVVSVISLMIIGIKTMTGSLEEKAEYKKALPGYVLGAVMVAAMTWLPSIIYNIVKDW